MGGLYGVLRPHDDIKPVRDLPMGALLQTKRGESMLEFWGENVTKSLLKDVNALLEGSEESRLLLVCCLSDEYWRVLQTRMFPGLKVNVIRVRFEGATDENVRAGYARVTRHVIRR